MSLPLAMVAGGCGRRRRVSHSGGANHGEGGQGDPGASPSLVEAPSARASAANPKTIAADVLKSVLSVRATGVRGRGAGSGFVIDDDGHVLTNAHIVKGASAVTLGLPDGRTVSARVIGAEEAADLAVLRMSTAGVAPADLGDGSDLRVGDSVLAVGAPLGLYGTVTAGIVAALKRTAALSRSGPRHEVIQTDVVINSDNTGGPLTNSDGEVVGVNTMLTTPARLRDDTIGIGFAVPIDLALEITQDLTG
ncbi:MAG: trypsin-like peptidase domain-containing protein [Micromonosporaceae bacterium]